MSDASQQRRVPEPFSIGGATHERLADVQSRFSARLRDRLEGGFWPGPGAGLASGVRVPGSGRSSVVFADAEESGEDVVCGADDGGLRMRGGSGSLYSSSSVGVVGESVLKERRKGGRVDLAAVPIMERPRASYRLVGNWDNSGGSRASLGFVGMGDNKRIGKGQKNERERLRLGSGRGKRPVSVEGRGWVGSLKGSINSEKPVRGNEAFL